MALVRVKTIMTGVAGSPYYNALYFGTTVAVPAQKMVDDVKNFWQAVASRMQNSLQGVVQGDVEEIDPTTGQVVNVYSLAQNPFSGSATGLALPPTTQMLVRIRTNGIENGRRIQGRVFVPHIAQSVGVPVPDATARTAVQNAAAALLAANDTGKAWVVYSPTYGVAAEVTSTSVWTQYAVQRSRRD